MFYLYAGTAPAHVAQVLEEFEAEIRRVATGGAKIEELRRCQTRLKAARRQALQTNASRALHASLQSLYGLTVNDAQEMDTAIDAVTLADLAGFADRYLRPERRLQLVVRPESAKA
jgi:zinc protease